MLKSVIVGMQICSMGLGFCVCYCSW